MAELTILVSDTRNTFRIFFENLMERDYLLDLHLVKMDLD